MSKLTYERAKRLYTPYDADQMRHLCALRDVEIERLRAENAELRERVAELDELLPENGRWFSFETVDAYVVENRKLRELVQDFDKCLTEAIRLAYIQGHATIYDGTLLDSLHPRMREMKIEVDG